MFLASVKLNDGHQMPLLGFGTWGIGGNAAYESVKTAIEDGYRHIDTAQIYGNEKEVGKAINDLVNSGKIKREDIFLVTKFFNTFHSKEDVIKGVKQSLTSLGLKYIDLMLVHRPADPKGDLVIWSGLEEAKNMGLVKSIGISNFNQQQLENVIKNSKVVPANNQILSNPFKNEEKLIEFCKSHKISVTAYSPLGHGDKRLLEHAVVKSIAQKHKKTAAQVLIRYHIERNVIVIPKTANKDRIKENFNVFDFSLTQDDMKQLNSLNGH